MKKLQGLHTSKDRQQALDAFAKQRELSGDDLSDIMYDIERAGFHNLKKPEGAKGGGSKPSAKEMRDAVVDNWRDANGGKLDWDERQQLHHFQEYASDQEIAETYENLGLNEVSASLESDELQRAISRSLGQVFKIGSAALLRRPKVTDDEATIEFASDLQAGKFFKEGGHYLGIGKFEMKRDGKNNIIVQRVKRDEDDEDYENT